MRPVRGIGSGRSGRTRTIAAAVIVAVCVVFLSACGGERDDAIRVGSVRAIAGWTTVPLDVRAGKASEVVAVTLSLDGRPVGSDTTSPYAVLVDGGSLRPGTHRARAELVLRDGTRLRSPAVDMRVQGGRQAGDIAVRTAAGLARAMPRLARGGVTVRLGPGRYVLTTPIHLGNDARLVGAGPRTVLAPAGGYDAIVSVKGSGARLERLTIDGGGDGAGAGRAVAVLPGTTAFVARRITIRDARVAGVAAWGRFADVSVQDSTISGGPIADAGVVAHVAEGDDISVIRSRIHTFLGWGVTYMQVPHDNTTSGLRAVALDNVVTDIDRPGDTQGTSEVGIWSGGARAAIIGNVVARAGWDGIETVGSSDDVSIVGNRVSDTPVGIYLEHATTRSLIARNDIRRVKVGINVEWEYGGVGSGENTFVENHVREASDVGIFVDVGADRNLLQGNRVEAREAGIVLQGSSDNDVRGNVVCGAVRALDQRFGRWDDNRLATPARNRLTDNTEGRCW